MVQWENLKISGMDLTVTCTFLFSCFSVIKNNIFLATFSMISWSENPPKSGISQHFLYNNFLKTVSVTILTNMYRKEIDVTINPALHDETFSLLLHLVPEDLSN